jgi:predicted transposase/invertase (TIGR01784 family)
MKKSAPQKPAKKATKPRKARTSSSGPLVRFDFAIKRLLRHKADFVVLEGFLTSVLRKQVKIQEILESESNQPEEDSKFNRVDMLVKLDGKDLASIEVQNDYEKDYFHRILFGASKAVCEHIKLGEGYEKIKKVYSVSIIYFDIGDGKGVVYHGKTEFRNIDNARDILYLDERQRDLFKAKTPADIYPEYYILRLKEFDPGQKETKKNANLVEWLRFLKTDQIPKTAKAPGLQAARERLAPSLMTPEELAAYKKHLESVEFKSNLASSNYWAGLYDGKQEGLAEGRAEGARSATLENASNLKLAGVALDVIAQATGLTVAEVNAL